MGGGYFWNAILSVCEPPDDGKCKGGGKPNSLGQCAPEPCPEGMALQADSTCKKKNEECPAGQIRSPLGSCIPGDNQCAQGEVRGKDGTCKKDKDGDGKPDEGEEGGEDSTGKRKDEFSGGDDCSTPPTCSGSPIMCGQARIQWRIDCNTRRNRNIAGGTCNAMPVCTGDKCDAMEYTQLVMQWRSACAIEKLAASKGDTPGGAVTDANSNGVADALEGQGAVTDAGTGASDVSGAKKWGIGVSSSMLDTTDMFGGGSCPQPPTIVIMGKSVSGSDVPYFCQLAAIMRALILVFGAYLALRILMGGGF
ncbi:virulence factor TspB C-terminal domain-related protein [Stenotrophomonas rhizophila]